MTLSNSLESYIDCKAIWERAFASEKGIKIEMGSPARANLLAHRLNKFRLLDRKSSEKIYPQGDPNYGKSIFDPFRVMKTKGEGVVEIRPLTIEGLEINEL